MMGGRIGLLGASLRLPNLPSVLSNVWVGLALAGSVVPAPPETLGFSPWLLMLAAAACYAGGTLLNDWHDRGWDAQHRPERALPQQAFAPSSYLLAALALFAVCMTLATLAGPSAGSVAGLLALTVIAYTRWHKNHAAAVALMGLCRALLPLLAMGGLVARVAGEGNWELAAALLAPSTALWIYTTGLSLIARNETSRTVAESPGMAWLPLPVVLLPAALALWTGAGLVLCLLGMAPFLTWVALALSRPGRKSAVSGLLAGFPLLDWVFLLPFGLLLLSRSGFSTYALLSLALPPLCFLAGWIMQRRWAAT